jgi:hypothetical protein
MNHEEANMDDKIKDVTPEEAVAQHEDGAMHCCAPGRWQQIADRLDPTDHPFLKGKLGRMTYQGIPDYGLACVDTRGLTKDQQNYVLHVFYGTPDPTNPDGSDEVGVVMLDKDLPAVQAIYDAKDKADRRRRR